MASDLDSILPADLVDACRSGRNRRYAGGAEADLDHQVRDRRKAARPHRGLIDAALALGHIDADRANPARWKGHFEHFAQAAKLTRGHHAAMRYADVPEFVQRLRAAQADNSSALALEFDPHCDRTSETLNIRLMRSISIRPRGGCRKSA